MASLILRDIVKRYGDTTVVHGANMEIGDGEFVVFVGPSGCGKSTLLRMIAGLEDISGGDLFVGGRRMNDVGAGDRGVAMVFQSYALYPHMTAFDNIAFGLKMATKLPKEEIKRRVQNAAATLQLKDLLQRKPRELSGGQRQRVAIGRAIVREPQVFLLDEPLSNLDAELRAQMRIELRRLHRRLGATMIQVTHDQVEAMTLAQRIIVLNNGRIEQAGAPMEIYRRPRNQFVAGFIGSPKMNFLPAQVVAADNDNFTLQLQTLANARLLLPVKEWRLRAGESVTVGARPNALASAADAESDNAAARFELEVEASERLGDATFHYCKDDNGDSVLVEATGDMAVPPGARLPLRLSPAAAHVFGEDGDSRRCDS